MIELGFPLRGDAGDHEHLYFWLNNCADHELISKADHLNTLRKMRNKADYRMNDANVEGPTTAEFQLKLAHGIVETLDSCSGDFARLGGIKVAIQNYRRDNPS